MNVIAPIGHNGPPDPIDAIEAVQARHDGLFSEVGNWLDGRPVENEAQMRAVDALLASVKEAEKEAKEAKEAEYRPHKAAGDAVIARWKPFLDDLDRQKKGLIAAVDAFKRKLDAEKREAQRKAEAEAWEATRAAREAAEVANAADIEAQRAAAQAMREAEEAQARAAAAKADIVKGLRARQVTEVKNMTEWARIAWRDHRAECEGFFDDLAQRQRPDIPGVVETRSERHAY